MITSTDIRNKKFEKAAFGYNQEEMDEFLSQLEAELDERDREREEANKKINILADKVRDYMKDEDALKDALLGAQKQGHQVINEAKDKAERIIREAQAKADSIINDAEMRHKNSIARYEAEIEAEEAELRKSLEEKGVTIIDVPAEDMAKAQEACQSVWAGYSEGIEDVLQAIVDIQK